MNRDNEDRLHATVDGLFPYGFVKELKAICRLSWPTVCSYEVSVSVEIHCRTNAGINVCYENYCYSYNQGRF